MVQGKGTDMSTMQKGPLYRSVSTLSFLIVASLQDVLH